MSKFKLPGFSWSDLFSRNSYDPTTFGEDINGNWDATSTRRQNDHTGKSSTTKFQNYKLPLADRIDALNHELELFDKAIPNRKK